jgi:hypothetical protein
MLGEGCVEMLDVDMVLLLDMGAAGWERSTK